MSTVVHHNLANEAAVEVAYSEESPLLGGFGQDARRARNAELGWTASFVNIILMATMIIFTIAEGSITTFPLYSNRMATDLGLSQAQVAAISTTGIMSVYLTMPLWGPWIADPGLLFLLAGLLSGGGYFLASWRFRSATTAEPMVAFYSMLIAFIMVATATSCALMSILAACAVQFRESERKELVKSILVAAFGLSSIVLGQIATHFFMKSSERQELDIHRYFSFLGTLSLVCAFATTVAFTFAGMHSTSRASTESQDRPGLSGSSTTSAAFLDAARNNPGIISLVKEPVLLWLAAGSFLMSGPCEVYINNMANVIHSVKPVTITVPVASLVSQQISTIAAASTAAKIIAGVVNDKITLRPRGQVNDFVSLRRRFMLLGGSGLVAGSGFLALVALREPIGLTGVSISNILIGLGFGGTFGLIPIVSHLWGAENLSTVWGLVGIAPAPGIGLFGLLQSLLYNLALGNEEECVKWRCYGLFASKSTLSVFLAIGAWAMAFWEVTKQKQKQSTLNCSN